MLITYLELASNIFWVLVCETQAILPSLHRTMKQRIKFLSFSNLKNPIVKQAVIKHYQKIWYFFNLDRV